jgi:transposase IS66 family protein
VAKVHWPRRCTNFSVCAAICAGKCIPRTGVFTSGVVSIAEGRRIALFFTGRQHAGENLADVLKQRAPGLPAPIQMCDALSRNAPKLSEGAELLVANCLAHGRRQFVEIAANFPEQCRYVLEALGGVYGHEAVAREQKLSPNERPRFHQEHSRPILYPLHGWMQTQLAEKKTEPNLSYSRSFFSTLFRSLMSRMTTSIAGDPRQVIRIAVASVGIDEPSRETRTCSPGGLAVPRP